MSKIKLGLILYSFTNEQRDRGWTTEDCIKAAKELGVSGIEIVASQTFGRSYPWPSAKEISEVRNLADKYELEICAYSGQADRGKKSSGYGMSEDDMFTLALNDLKYAYMIGAPAQRQQNNISPNVLRRLAPWAEKYRVKVGIEMHQPMTPCEERSMDFNRVFDEVDSPYIGWTPDFGMFSTGMYNARFADKLNAIPSRMNISEEICQFCEDHIGMDLEKAKEAVMKMPMTEKERAIMEVFFTRGDVAGEEARKNLWTDFEKVTLPHAVHMHGKFHELGEDGDDKLIPTSRILDIVKASDYEGYISIEYEGHFRFPDRPAYPVLRRHVKFYREVLGIR